MHFICRHSIHCPLCQCAFVCDECSHREHAIFRNTTKRLTKSAIVWPIVCDGILQHAHESCTFMSFSCNFLCACDVGFHHGHNGTQHNKAIVGARSDHRDWQEALAFRFWKREKEINKKTLMTKGSELKPYNFVKCSKKMSTVHQTDTLISERKENYSNSSVNFFFTLSIDKSPECIEFNW